LKSLSPSSSGVAPGFAPVLDVDFSTEADQSPSANTLTLGGLTFDVENSANDANAGPAVASGVLRIEPDTTVNLNQSSRTCPLIGIAWSDLVPGVVMGDTLRVWLGSTVSASANFQWLTLAVENAAKIGIGPNDYALAAFKGYSGAANKSNLKWYGTTEASGTLGDSDVFLVMELQLGGGATFYTAPSYGGTLTALTGSQPMAHEQRPNVSAIWSTSARLLIGCVASSISGGPTFDLDRLVVEKLATS